MNRSYGVGDLPAGTSAPFANGHSSQLFCPIAFYSKLSAEAIDTNETPANIKRLGNALNRMHFNLCDSHHSFIVTHQSICSICHAFIEKYESLIFDDQLTDQMVRNQLMIGDQPASKPDNELDDKVARNADPVAKPLGSKHVDNVDRTVDRTVERTVDRAVDRTAERVVDRTVERAVNRGVDRENGAADCKEVDSRVNGGRPEVAQRQSDNSRLDKARFCYYCNELQLNRLPGVRNLPAEVTVQIGESSKPPNGVVNKVAANASAALPTSRPSTVSTNHQRHHSDSFIRLKSRTESEQFV